MLLPETKAKRLLEHFHPHLSQNLNIISINPPTTTSELHLIPDTEMLRILKELIEDLSLGIWLRSAGHLKDGMTIDNDEEPKDQKLEAYYIYMAKIQEVLSETAQESGPTYDTEPMEKDANNVTPNSSDISSNERKVDQDAEKNNEECMLLASLIANLKFDIDHY
ncbi:hypothetical protein Tco_0509430 [Tanacetum coccineum]